MSPARILPCGPTALLVEVDRGGGQRATPADLAVALHERDGAGLLTSCPRRGPCW
ncbi:hypothetical protein [Pseudactinotalea sp. HY158]|uniref:hypothetical protein n=1 Tax=Pseudactinotalea sp. HY158 TaxID=2654547 RepID=UPI001E4114AC|nr:hypothetical protein [Pseudactinotalea sp. HY158]